MYDKHITYHIFNDLSIPLKWGLPRQTDTCLVPSDPPEISGFTRDAIQCGPFSYIRECSPVSRVFFIRSAGVSLHLMVINRYSLIIDDRLTYTVEFESGHDSW